MVYKSPEELSCFAAFKPMLGEWPDQIQDLSGSLRVIGETDCGGKHEPSRDRAALEVGCGKAFT
jgi:hypothetical protein